MFYLYFVRFVHVLFKIAEMASNNYLVILAFLCDYQILPIYIIQPTSICFNRRAADAIRRSAQENPGGHFPARGPERVHCGRPLVREKPVFEVRARLFAQDCVHLRYVFCCILCILCILCIWCLYFVYFVYFVFF